MANPPPPYSDITGISRAVMKDNAQVTLANYNGNARPGELVVDQITDQVYISNSSGALTQISSGSVANVGNLTISAGSAAWVFGTDGVLTLANGATLKESAGGALGALALGYQAGQTSQGIRTVAIGQSAGQTSQSARAVAIGQGAGQTSQGGAAVAIGAFAGATSQGTNSIILNATGANLDQTTANTFTVKPVRAVTSVTFAAPTAGSVPAGFSPVYYNPTTGELIVITT